MTLLLTTCPGCGKRRAIRHSKGITTCVSALRPALDDFAGSGDPPSGDASSAARSAMAGRSSARRGVSSTSG